MLPVGKSMSQAEIQNQIQRLYEISSLTDELTDDEAQKLLGWAEQQVPKIAEQDTKLYWFLETLDNRSNAETLEFSISFDTLVTGVSGNNSGQIYYTNNCCLENARNKAYVRWYETSAGAGNNRGEANSGGRLSGVAQYDIKIRQPNPTIIKSSTPANVIAGQIVTHTLTIFGAGNDIAYDISVVTLSPLH
jgi:hypothetical protein